jgi:Uma2 family endonuclease
MSLADKLADNYTYKDYLSWPEDERWEIIDGEAYSMSPAPSRMHQKLSSILSGEIYQFLKKKKTSCEVYAAPFDVKFPPWFSRISVWCAILSDWMKKDVKEPRT